VQRLDVGRRAGDRLEHPLEVAGDLLERDPVGVRARGRFERRLLLVVERRRQPEKGLAHAAERLAERAEVAEHAVERGALALQGLELRTAAVMLGLEHGNARLQVGILAGEFGALRLDPLQCLSGVVEKHGVSPAGSGMNDCWHSYPTNLLRYWRSALMYIKPVGADNRGSRTIYPCGAGKYAI